MSYITGDIFVYEPPKITLKAWKPLADCRNILFEFQNSDVDEERSEWRINWVAGISLLRTTGHVLRKVDSLTSAVHRLEIDNLWKEWQNQRIANSIFWEFIEKERNNILKTYDFGASLAKDGDGYFVRYSDGSDAFQLFRESVYWWRHQLDFLESKL